MSVPDDSTPMVDLVIALNMAEHPGLNRSEQAEYYEAVHQELAPLARSLARSGGSLFADAHIPDLFLHRRPEVQKLH